MLGYYFTTPKVVVAVIVAPSRRIYQSCDLKLQSTLEHALSFLKCVMSERVFMNLVLLK